MNKFPITVESQRVIVDATLMKDAVPYRFTYKGEALIAVSSGDNVDIYKVNEHE